MALYCPGQNEEGNGAIKSNGYYFKSESVNPGSVGINYTENNVSIGDTAHTVCWICRERSSANIIGVPL